MTERNMEHGIRNLEKTDKLFDCVLNLSYSLTKRPDRGWFFSLVFPDNDLISLTNVPRLPTSTSPISCF